MTLELDLHTVADAIVVGAGLSGLQVALNIQMAGYSCIVLEANSRVGGKTLSIKSSPKQAGVNDIGAAWVNDSNQSEIWKLFDKYNVGAIIQRATGTSLKQSEDGSTTAHLYHKESTVSSQRPYSIDSTMPLLIAIIRATMMIGRRSFVRIMVPSKTPSRFRTWNIQRWEMTHRS